MKNQIVKSILCLAMTMPFMALADTNISVASDTEDVISVLESDEELISSADPIDLLPGSSPSARRAILNTFPLSAEKTVPSRTESETSTAIDVITSDYGRSKPSWLKRVGIPQLPSP